MAWVHRLTDVEGDKGTCAHCGPVDVVQKSMGGGRRAPRCGVAVREQRKTPNRHPPGSGWDEWRGQERRHGMTLSESRAYLAGKVCAICGAAENLHVDHDHATKEVRGALCRSCNWGLGRFKDRIDLLEAAAAYLRRSASGTCGASR